MAKLFYHFFFASTVNNDCFYSNQGMIQMGLWEKLAANVVWTVFGTVIKVKAMVMGDMVMHELVTLIMVERMTDWSVDLGMGATIDMQTVVVMQMKLVLN